MVFISAIPRMPAFRDTDRPFSIRWPRQQDTFGAWSMQAAQRRLAHRGHDVIPFIPKSEPAPMRRQMFPLIVCRRTDACLVRQDLISLLRLIRAYHINIIL